MAGLTQTQLEDELTELIAARSTILRSQSYAVAGRTLTRANLAEVNRRIREVDAQLRRMTDPTGGVILARFAEPQ